MTLGFPKFIPKDGATFFKELMNSLVTASSLHYTIRKIQKIIFTTTKYIEAYLLLLMTAHLAQLTTEYCFQLRKQLPQSAFSILYEAVAFPLPTIVSGSRILDHDNVN